MLTALENWHMSSVDVKTAFLYRELDKELYMKQPEGFKIPDKEHLVLWLKCAIYRLKQAALQWWKVLNKSIAKLGFKCLLSDLGIFVYKDKNGAPKVIVVIYVDNAIFLGQDISIVRRVKDLFMKIWECQDLGDTKEFLCMRIVRQWLYYYWLAGLFVQSIGMLWFDQCKSITNSIAYGLCTHS
jgi:hypothetical protein